MSSQNYYETLGVAKSATMTEIKKAYRVLSKRYHPDKPEADEEKMIEISEAYAKLGDADKRKAYDKQQRAKGIAAEAAPQERAEKVAQARARQKPSTAQAKAFGDAIRNARDSSDRSSPPRESRSYGTTSPPQSSQARPKPRRPRNRTHGRSQASSSQQRPSSQPEQGRPLTPQEQIAALQAMLANQGGVAGAGPKPPKPPAAESMQPVGSVPTPPRPPDEHSVRATASAQSRLRDALSIIGSLLVLISGAIGAIVAACAAAFVAGLAIAFGFFLVVVLPLWLLTHH